MSGPRAGRRKGPRIGGTDIPALLGLIPKRNALDVYNRKTRPSEPRPDWLGIDIWRGNEYEDKAREEYWERTGRRGRVTPDPTTHPDYPAFECHTDFLIFADEARASSEKPWTAGTGVGETKCPRAFVCQRIADVGLRESELVQGLTYAAVGRYDWCGFNFYSAEYDRGPTLAVDIEAQPELGAQILDIGQSFYDEHILRLDPPAPDKYFALGDELVEHVRESTGELLVVKDEDWVELGRLFLEAMDLEKQAKSGKKEIGERLLLRITDEVSDRIQVPGVGKFTAVRSSGRKSFNADSLRLHRPLSRDLVRAYLMEVYRELHGEVALDEALVAIVESKLAELELDLDDYETRGAPSAHVRGYPEKKGAKKP